MAGLKGKAGIVTGGSSGIGFQIANVLAEAGATVYVISRTGKPKEGVGESAPGVVHLKGDVGDVEAMKVMVADLAAKHGGCLDFLVNNGMAALITKHFPIDEAVYELFRNPVRLETVRRTMSEIAHPDATERLAEFVLRKR